MINWYKSCQAGLTASGTNHTYVGMDTKSPPETPSHRSIIARNGGPSALGKMISVDPNTVKAWNRLDSIPAPHWQSIASARAATLAELAAAAAKRTTPAKPATNQAAAEPA